MNNGKKIMKREQKKLLSLFDEIVGNDVTNLDKGLRFLMVARARLTSLIEENQHNPALIESLEHCRQQLFFGSIDALSQEIWSYNKKAEARLIDEQVKLIKTEE